VYEQKDRENVFVDHKPSLRVTDLLAESNKAIRVGNSQTAYELSLRATEIEPQNIEAWLLRATLAPTLEERILCVNYLNELAPNHQDRYDVAFFALKELLDKNPYLAYLEETEELYRVVHANQVLNIPKKRAPVNPSPLEETQSHPLKWAYHWLAMAILGLLLAGIGTLIFAPLAAFAALRAQESVQSRSERVRSTVVSIVASGLFLIGILFSVLFLLHWFG
jgi:tetratricopeptide (TPR) repeat protein